MNTVIAYDSWYGNTQRIAEAIAQGIGGTVKMVHLQNKPRLKLHAFDLLVVGSPTHGGMPTPVTLEWLHAMKPHALAGMHVSAFDTRLPSGWIKFFGFASKHIAKLLIDKGGLFIAPPLGSYVQDQRGPLQPGELQHAEEWGRALSHAVQGMRQAQATRLSL